MQERPSTEPLRALKRQTAALPTPWVSEIVLQTNQFIAMKEWYPAVLGIDWFLENNPIPTADEHSQATDGKQARASNVRSCFMRLPTVPPFGCILALFEITSLGNVPTSDPGLNHMQLKQRDLATLVRRVELMREAGLDPHRSANHGPMTSFYYKDPDQNIIELCIDNFDTPEEMNSFIQSEKFRANPSGLEIDRDDFVRRYRDGEPAETLLAI